MRQPAEQLDRRCSSDRKTIGVLHGARPTKPGARPGSMRTPGAVERRWWPRSDARWSPDKFSDWVSRRAGYCHCRTTWACPSHRGGLSTSPCRRAALSATPISPSQVLRGFCQGHCDQDPRHSRAEDCDVAGGPQRPGHAALWALRRWARAGLRRIMEKYSRCELRTSQPIQCPVSSIWSQGELLAMGLPFWGCVL